MKTLYVSILNCAVFTALFLVSFYITIVLALNTPREEDGPSVFAGIGLFYFYFIGPALPIISSSLVRLTTYLARKILFKKLYIDSKVHFISSSLTIPLGLTIVFFIELIITPKEDLTGITILIFISFLIFLVSNIIIFLIDRFISHKNKNTIQ